MTGQAFVAVTITFRDDVLLPIDVAATSPVSATVVSGTRLRGVLAQQCRLLDPTLMDAVVISGDIESATAFPTSRSRTGHPPPRTALIARRTGHPPRILDARDQIPDDVRTDSLTGLVARDFDEWIPIPVRTRTVQRSTRLRAGGSADGLGPMTSTVICAQQQFTARLRLRGNPTRQEELHEMLRLLLHNKTIQIGGGKDTAFGGDPLFSVGALEHFPEADNLDDTSAGAELDIVLRSPALVPDAATGHYRPDAIRAALDALLADCGIDARTISAALTPYPVAGAATGYGRIRPTQWAAGPGSVLRLRTRSDVTAEQWHHLTAHRLGHRTVDGLGAIGIDPPCTDPAGGFLADPAHPDVHTPTGAVVIATGPPASRPRSTNDITGSGSLADHRAADQLSRLQNTLFTAATDRWITYAAAEILDTYQGFDSVPRSVWGRVRAVVHDRTALLALTTKLRQGAPDTEERGGTPAADHLSSVRLAANVPLLQWLHALATDERTTYWQAALTAVVRDRWTAELTEVLLLDSTEVPTSPPQLVRDWIGRYRLDTAHRLGGAVVTGAHARSRS